MPALQGLSFSIRIVIYPLDRTQAANIGDRERLPFDKADLSDFSGNYRVKRIATTNTD
jgi:hypothetical protein